MVVALFPLVAMSQAALNQAVLVMLSLTASGEITKEADRNREGMVLGSISRLFDANGCTSRLSSVFVSVSVSVTIRSISCAATRWALYTARQAVSRASEPASLSGYCARSKDDRIVPTLVSTH